MAGGDIGAEAARRQGELAENLYPFKLVYDDGTERLGCDSARDRGMRIFDGMLTGSEMGERHLDGSGAHTRQSSSSSFHARQSLLFPLQLGRRRLCLNTS